MDRLTIITPDDWHLHLRDTPYLEAVVHDSARQFGRAIIMPNLNPPVRSVEDALAYRQRILAALPEDSGFQPLMTLYLTDNTRVADIEAASESPYIFGAKLYPAGATTNSESGVTDLARLDQVFEAMQKHRFMLQVHGEATGPEVDVFDREKVFIEKSLERIRRDFPELPIVFEHITTLDAVDYVRTADANLAATITPHHLLINRNAIFLGGIRPHHYCLPVAKREIHRQALIAAALSGDARFFAGTDSAPHSKQAKESACGCAGIYSAHSALELYAEAFERGGDFTHFEAFMSRHGADYYGLPYNQGQTRLERQPWTLPESLPYPDSGLIPFRAAETLNWKQILDD
ncbi:MAG: dihydroorotase [Gammaproteobacteria bacterium]|nr:MAG: dihydroorotase [Gammaproteobacteria bacterium]UCH41782.1 MAG: dihydroorotase [Gammaproteobacteria bacterium]